MLPPAVPFDERTRRLGIAAAIGAISAVGISIGLGLPLLAITLEQRGYSASAIGYNSAMAGVSSLIVTPFVPRLAHHFGAARFLLAVLVVATLSFPLFFVFESYAAWIVLRFVFHGAINAAFILSEFWINALAPPGRRGLVLGIYATVLSVGFAFGPMIFALVGSDGALPYLVGAVVLAISTLPVLFALSADPPMEEKPGVGLWRFFWIVPLATFAAFTMGAAESGLFSFIAIYGLRLGYPEADAALLVSALAIGNVVSQIPLGIISDRMDRRILLLIIAVVGALAAAAVPYVSESRAMVFVMVAVFGSVSAGLYTVGLSHLGARLHGSDLASANAAFIFLYAVGMLIGPATAGAAIDLWPPHGVMYSSAAIVAAYAVLAAVRILATRPRS